MADCAFPVSSSAFPPQANAPQRVSSSDTPATRFPDVLGEMTQQAEGDSEGNSEPSKSRKGPSREEKKDDTRLPDPGLMSGLWPAVERRELPRPKAALSLDALAMTAPPPPIPAEQTIDGDGDSKPKVLPDPRIASAAVPVLQLLPNKLTPSLHATAAGKPVETLGSAAPSSADPAVRVVPAKSVDRGEIAFQMKLAAAPQPANDTPDAFKGNGAKPASLSEPAARPAAATRAEAPAPMETASASATRPHKEDAPREESAAAKAPHYPGASEQPMSPAAGHAESGGASSGGHESKDSGAAEHLEAAPPDLPAEPPKSTEAARNIKLELSGGDQRVEVRLMDRGGDIQVAVRTADAHLAGTLRDNLQGLSARLTESGFRTESGQDSGLQQHRDGRDQHFQQQQQQQQQQHREQTQQPDRLKQKGKDFEWLMSTLR